MHCPICNTSLNGENFCPSCGQAIDYSGVEKQKDEPQQPQYTYAPTYVPVPDAIKKWNWGAFSYNITWGIGNKTYLPLLCLIPYFNLIWMFVCGIKGNEWAWKSNHYQPEDVEKFLAIQNTWNRAGMANFIIGLISIILAFLFIFIFTFAILGSLNGFNY